MNSDVKLSFYNPNSPTYCVTIGSLFSPIFAMS